MQLHDIHHPKGARQLDGMCLARFLSLSRWQGVGVDPTLESFAFGDLCLVRRRREPNLWDF